MSRFRTLRLLVGTIIAFTFSSIILSGCGNDSFPMATATISDTGDWQDGGCGWVVIIDSVEYQPINLPTDFQSEGLAVQISYADAERNPECTGRIEVKGTIYIHKIAGI